jgi:hypothetical protein
MATTHSEEHRKVERDITYLAAGRLTDQTITSGTWAGKIIVMDVRESNGIIHVRNSGVYVLEEGRTYRITAQLGWKGTTVTNYTFHLVNAVSGEQIGQSAIVMPSDYASHQSPTGFLDVIFTPPEIGYFCLRVSPDAEFGSSSVIRADVGTYLNIIELVGGKPWPEKIACSENQTGAPVYVSAGRSTEQTISSGTWSDKVVIMDSVLESNGIKYNSKTGMCTLNGGVTYRITAQLGWKGSAERYNATYYAFGLFKCDTNEYIGPMVEALSPALTSKNASGCVLDVIHTPREDGQYCLKMSSYQKGAGTSSRIRADVSTYMNIVALSGGMLRNLGPGVEYLTAERSTNQIISYLETWGGKNIIMDKIRTNHGMIYDRSDGGFVLSAGKTYRITAQLSWYVYGGIPSPPSRHAFGLFNFITGEQIGPMAEMLPPNLHSTDASGGVLDVVFTPKKTGYHFLRMAPNTQARYDRVISAHGGTFMNIVTL